VYREILWMRAEPKHPRYYDARPATFPPEITVFHTGLLYSSVRQAGGTLSSKIATYRSTAIFISAILFVVLLNMIVPANADEEGTYSRIFILVLVSVSLIVAEVVAGCLFRRELRRIDDKMEDVARRLGPAFGAAGHEIEYQSSQKSWYSPSCESYFRIAPRCAMVAGGTMMMITTADDECRKAEALMKPFAAATESASGRTTTTRTFRVAVYGPNAQGGRLCSGDEINFISDQSFDQVKNRIDMGTWGAVATEMRPLTEKYWTARMWTINVLLLPICFYWYVPAAWTAQTWSLSLLFAWEIVAAVQLLCPAPVETWWFDFVLRCSVLDQMRDKVAHLSPLVEERSGYTLRFDTERYGCCDDIDGYVYFDLTDSSTATHCEEASSGETETEGVGTTLV
jgi:hypothetical protein